MMKLRSGKIIGCGCAARKKLSLYPIVKLKDLIDPLYPIVKLKDINLTNVTQSESLADERPNEKAKSQGKSKGKSHHKVKASEAFSDKYTENSNVPAKERNSIQNLHIQRKIPVNKSCEKLKTSRNLSKDNEIINDEINKTSTSNIHSEKKNNKAKNKKKQKASENQNSDNFLEDGAETSSIPKQRKRHANEGDQDLSLKENDQQLSSSKKKKRKEMHSADENAPLRQSFRQKFPPLEAGRNERLLYRIEDVLSYDPGTYSYTGNNEINEDKAENVSDMNGDAHDSHSSDIQDTNLLGFHKMKNCIDKSRENSRTKKSLCRSTIETVTESPEILKQPTSSQNKKKKIANKNQENLRSKTFSKDNSGCAFDTSESKNKISEDLDSKKRKHVNRNHKNLNVSKNISRNNHVTDTPTKGSELSQSFYDEKKKTHKKVKASETFSATNTVNATDIPANANEISQNSSHKTKHINGISKISKSVKSSLGNNAKSTTDFTADEISLNFDNENEKDAIDTRERLVTSFTESTESAANVPAMERNSMQNLHKTITSNINENASQALIGSSHIHLLTPTKLTDINLTNVTQSESLADESPNEKKDRKVSSVFIRRAKSQEYRNSLQITKYEKYNAEVKEIVHVNERSLERLTEEQSSLLSSPKPSEKNKAVLNNSAIRNSESNAEYDETTAVVQKKTYGIIKNHGESECVSKNKKKPKENSFEYEAKTASIPKKTKRKRKMNEDEAENVTDMNGDAQTTFIHKKRKSHQDISLKENNNQQVSSPKKKRRNSSDENAPLCQSFRQKFPPLDGFHERPLYRIEGSIPGDHPGTYISRNNHVTDTLTKGSELSQNIYHEKKKTNKKKVTFSATITVNGTDIPSNYREDEAENFTDMNGDANDSHVSDIQDTDLLGFHKMKNCVDKSRENSRTEKSLCGIVKPRSSKNKNKKIANKNQENLRSYKALSKDNIQSEKNKKRKVSESTNQNSDLGIGSSVVSTETTFIHKKRRKTNSEMHSTDENVPLRRSVRKKFRPQEVWRNERLLYQVRGGIPFVAGEDPGFKNQLASPEKKKKKEKRKPKVIQRLIHTMDGQRIYAPLMKQFDAVPWQDHGKKIMFNTSSSRSGFIELNVNKERPLLVNPTEDMYFIVVKGKVQPIIGNNVELADEKSIFVVPRCVPYSIKNLGPKKALLAFIVGDFRYLESIE